MKIVASSSITSWQIDGATVADFIFWGSNISADGDCSHEIKRCLLLGRKVMTNLDIPHAKGSRGGSRHNLVGDCPPVPPNPNLHAPTSGLRKVLADGPWPECCVKPDRATASPYPPISDCAESPLDASRPSASLPAPILPRQATNRRPPEPKQRRGFIIWYTHLWGGAQEPLHQLIRPRPRA